MTESVFPDAPPKKKAKKKRGRPRKKTHPEAKPLLSGAEIAADSAKSFASRLTDEILKICESDFERQSLQCLPGMGGSIFFHLCGKRVEVTKRQQEVVDREGDISNLAYGVRRRAVTKTAKTSGYTVEEHQRDLRTTLEDVLKAALPAEKVGPLLDKVNAGALVSPDALQQDVEATNLLREEIIERLKGD